MWIVGIPRRPASTYGSLVPWAGVLHRTYGNWAGDLAVGLGSRAPIGFHLLVGPGDGQWVQFAPLTRLCYHAKGANSWAFGVEVTGRNEDPFTDWQVRACAHIIRESSIGLGIPLTYYDSGRMGQRRGFVAHNAVAGSDHTDRWGDNWSRVLAALGGPELRRYVYVKDLVNPAGPGGWTLDGWGGVHPWGGAPVVYPPGYWPGWNICRDLDLVLTAAGAVAGYKLDGLGGLHGWNSEMAIPEPLRRNGFGNPSWYFGAQGGQPGQDLCRRVVLLRDPNDGRRGVFRPERSVWAPAGAVIDAWGGVHPFNGATPEDFAGHPWWEGGMIQEVSAPA